MPQMDFHCGIFFKLNQMKNFSLIVTLSLLLSACQQNSPVLREFVYTVETMGTSGTIKYRYTEGNSADIHLAIDSILIFVNQSMSTYIPDSEISTFNNLISYRRDELMEMNFSEAFKEVLSASEIAYDNTQGAFNPLVKPLIDFWGFGAGAKSDIVDSAQIASLLNCVDFEFFRNIPQENTDTLCFQLDFSAIAKGYGVDLVAKYLESQGIENYMVEIGGEVSCRGTNAKDELWRMGIEKPNEEVRELYGVVALQNRAMATSGNYRNFRILPSGQKVVHIVNPVTGYSVQSNLLSASVFAHNCMYADAYATACMVLGKEKCFELIGGLPGIDVYLIYSDDDGILQHIYTEGISQSILSGK